MVFEKTCIFWKIRGTLIIFRTQSTRTRQLGLHENSDEKTQTTKTQTRKLGGENSDDEKRKLRRENSDEIYKDIAASAAKENVAEGWS